MAACGMILYLHWLIFFCCFVYRGNVKLSFSGILTHAVISFICIFISRLLGNIYKQIWSMVGTMLY